MSQIISSSQAKMMIKSKLLCVYLLIVIVSLLGTKVVSTMGEERTAQTSSSALDRVTPTATSETGGQTPDKASNKQSQTGASPPPAAKLSNDKTEQQASNRKCEYEKGQWDECEANGAQRKVMKLKWGGPECKPTKTIRRDCRTKGEVGCKYARGEWSSVCQGGLRVRVDTLVGPAAGGRADESARANHMKCKPQRRVTRDCRRTCHYTKSGWSECSNGFRTRVLTLANQVDSKESERGDESNSRTSDGETSLASNDRQLLTRTSTTNQTDNQICVRQKLIRRKCTSAESKTSGRSTSVQQRENTQQAGATSSNLTPAQRRRLKQLQLKQQQQTSVTTTGSPQPTTTTATNRVRTTTSSSSSSGSSLTSRGGVGDGGGGGGSSSIIPTAATTSAAANLATKTTTVAKSGRR